MYQEIPKQYEEGCEAEADADSSDDDDPWKDREVTFQNSRSVSLRFVMSERTAVTHEVVATCNFSLLYSMTKGHPLGLSNAVGSDSDDSSDEELTSSPAVIRSRVDPSMEVDPPATGWYLPLFHVINPLSSHCIHLLPLFTRSPI